MLPCTCMGFSMEFHGTLESPNKKSPSSMGFHGIRRAPFQVTQVFHGIPWNIPWNSIEPWYRQMKYNLVPWNSMEYSMEFHETLVPPNEISLSSMEFHGTLRLSSTPCQCSNVDLCRESMLATTWYNQICWLQEYKRKLDQHIFIWFIILKAYLVPMLLHRNDVWISP